MPFLEHIVRLQSFLSSHGQQLCCFVVAAAHTTLENLAWSCREKVRGIATLDGGLRLEATHLATDGTRKLMFRLTVSFTAQVHLAV